MPATDVHNRPHNPFSIYIPARSALAPAKQNWLYAVFKDAVTVPGWANMVDMGGAYFSAAARLIGYGDRFECWRHVIDLVQRYQGVGKPNRDSCPL
jgi:hypothetical protein